MFWKQWFCNHQYEQIAQRFLPPFKGKWTTYDEELHAKLAWGFTLTTFKCTKCGRIEFIENLGDVTQ